MAVNSLQVQKSMERKGKKNSVPQYKLAKKGLLKRIPISYVKPYLYHRMTWAAEKRGKSLSAWMIDALELATTIYLRWL